MPADELSAPLGQDKRPRQHRNGLSFLQLVAAALGALAITIVGWAMLVEDPLGGEPMAIAPVDLAAAAKAKPEKPIRLHPRSAPVYPAMVAMAPATSRQRRRSHPAGP